MQLCKQADIQTSALGLSILLPLLISQEQSGFVKGRLIQDNILLAQDLVQDIRRKIRGSNVAIKLDMHKAYDFVNWIRC